MRDRLHSVELDTGDVGVVVFVDPSHTVRPTVRLIGTVSGLQFRVPRDLDLREHTDVQIVATRYD